MDSATVTHFCRRNPPPKIASNLRSHLCTDALLRSVQDAVCHIPDYRQGDVPIPLDDALMSAFAMFSLESPSLLAVDKEKADKLTQSPAKRSFL